MSLVTVFIAEFAENANEVSVPSESLAQSYFVNISWTCESHESRREKKHKNIIDMKSPTRHHRDLISVLIIAYVAVNLVTVSANSDHCKDHKFANVFNVTYMQLTKEIVTQEYAIEGEFKNLHCCAKGYRSIEW